MESLLDLSQALYDPGLRLYIIHKDLFYKGRELKLSDSRGFKMETFINEVKAGKHDGKQIVKNEPMNSQRTQN